MLSILRNVARSSGAPRALSLPRLSASAAARPAALSPFYARSISWSGSGNSPAPSENPAAEAQADAATPDVKVEEAAKEAEVKEDPKIAELEAKVKEQAEKVADLTSRLQYSVSDFQNLQRRSAEEFAQASEKGIKKFAGDLLSTIDILTLALKHVPQPIPADNVALKALFDGVEMTQIELLKTLKKHGVEPINPVGEKFDPHFHEALYMAPVPGKEPGTVLEVQQVGYTLKGKSLRAAQVGVVRD